MKLIYLLDAGGKHLTNNKRRVAADVDMAYDMLRLVGNKTLYMSKYSYVTEYDYLGKNKVKVISDKSEIFDKDAFVFIEDNIFNINIDDVDEIYVYYLDHYLPADTFCHFEINDKKIFYENKIKIFKSTICNAMSLVKYSKRG